jgi:uncharacterized membrane protein
MLAIPIPAAEAAEVLSYHALEGYIPEPFESHRLFGAGFLFLAVMLLMETVSGKTWHKHVLRTEIWPATLMILGVGMLVVTIVDPNDRVPHLIIGLAMIAAAIAERRFRFGLTSRKVANIFVIGAMFAGGMEIGILHSHGSVTSQAFMVHVALGFLAMSIVPIRLLQAKDPASAPKNALTGIAVLIMGILLLGVSH